MATKFNKMYREIISQMNEDIMRSLGFGKQVDDVHNGICPTCGAKVDPEGFRDDISRREFKISGMCQACQDETFGGPEEDDECPECENPEGNIQEVPEDYRMDKTVTNCKTCGGTGYIKSHSDEPDRPCPSCSVAGLPEDDECGQDPKANLALALESKCKGKKKAKKSCKK